MPTNGFMMRSEPCCKYQTAGVHSYWCHPLPQMLLNILLAHRNGFIGNFLIPKGRIHKVTTAQCTVDDVCTQNWKHKRKWSLKYVQKRQLHNIYRGMFAPTVRRQNLSQDRLPKSIMYLVKKAVDTNRHMNISWFLLVKRKLQVLFNLSKAPR